MDAKQRVLVALEQVEAAGAHWVVRAGSDAIWNIAHALFDFGGGHPGWPLFLAADLGDAVPRQGFFPDGHAVADRLALGQHVLAIASIGFDDDTALGFLAVEVDDVT